MRTGEKRGAKLTGFVVYGVDVAKVDDVLRVGISRGVCRCEVKRKKLPCSSCVTHQSPSAIDW